MAATAHHRFSSCHLILVSAAAAVGQQGQPRSHSTACTAPQLTTNHSHQPTHLELVAAAAAVLQQRDADLAAGRLADQQPHQKDGGLAQAVQRVNARPRLAAATRGAPAGRQAVQGGMVTNEG